MKYLFALLTFFIIILSCSDKNLNSNSNIDASLGSTSSNQSKLANNEKNEALKKSTVILLNDKEISFEDFEKRDKQLFTSVLVEKDPLKINEMGYDTLDILRIFLLKE